MARYQAKFEKKEGEVFSHLEDLDSDDRMDQLGARWRVVLVVPSDPERQARYAREPGWGICRRHHS